MTTFCIAYKNEQTTKMHEQQGSDCGGWVRISSFVSFEEARRIFDIRKDEYKNSAVGLFAVHDDDDLAWFQRSPRFLSNRHIVFSQATVRLAFGGLINSRSSDWF
jgi:hypothetical protein